MRCVTGHLWGAIGSSEPLTTSIPPQVQLFANNNAKSCQNWKLTPVKDNRKIVIAFLLFCTLFALFFSVSLDDDDL